MAGTMGNGVLGVPRGIPFYPLIISKISMQPVTPQFENLSIADLKVQAPERHFSRPSVVHSGSKYSSLPP